MDQDEGEMEDEDKMDQEEGKMDQDNGKMGVGKKPMLLTEN